MITLDAAVLLRYIVGDVPEQAVRAKRLLEEQLTPAIPGFVPLIAMYEAYWVMRSNYRVADAEARTVLAGLLDLTNLVIEHREILAEALNDNAGLADALIHRVGRSQGATKTVTFDRKFTRLPGVELLSDD